MNKNWKSYWKLLANSKGNTAVFHAQYCLLKAFGAKANNKKEIAQALIRRAFTPKDGCNWDRADICLHTAFWAKKIFGLDQSLFFADKEEIQQYKDFINELVGTVISKTEPDYMFIFVRQDISPEQQAVQAAHATYVAGAKFEPKDPEQTHFVLIGISDEAAMLSAQELLQEHDTEYVSFKEPDLGDIVTAIATEKMKESQKRFLKKYKKLVF
jgi:hypothetical protein